MELIKGKRYKLGWKCTGEFVKVKDNGMAVFDNLKNNIGYEPYSFGDDKGLYGFYQWLITEEADNTVPVNLTPEEIALIIAANKALSVHVSKSDAVRLAEINQKLTKLLEE